MSFVRVTGEVVVNPLVLLLNCRFEVLCTFCLLWVFQSSKTKVLFVVGTSCLVAGFSIDSRDVSLEGQTNTLLF